jgi:metal-responsive CopG/Arc/MetJ family transcriptional regulator
MKKNLDKKYVRVCITLEPETLAELEIRRGKVLRSTVINDILKEYFATHQRWV